MSRSVVSTTRSCVCCSGARLRLNKSVQSMKALFSRLIPQPLTAILVGGVALIILVAAWPNAPAIALDATGAQTGLIAIFLAAAVISAGMNPIHLRHNLKIFLTTVPLYVAATLLSPLLAAFTAGVSILVLQLLTRSQHGNTPSDIATAASRWVISAFLSAWVAQRAASDHMPMPLLLLSVAVIMFTCDIVTGALEIAPRSGEPHWRVMAVLLREAGPPEAAQYLLGILAALAAAQQAWSLTLWILPLCIVHQSFKYAKEMHEGTSRLLESMADAVD